MTEGELKERIARFDASCDKDLCLFEWEDLKPWRQEGYLRKAEEIISMVKEAGWVQDTRGIYKGYHDVERFYTDSDLDSEVEDAGRL